MYVPPEKRTAAWRLFHLRYQVRIPESFLQSPEYTRTVGYNISGDRRIDSYAPHRLATVNQTGAGIAVLHGQGVPLEEAFVVPSQIPQLYNDIQEHLNDWHHVAFQGVHPDAAPPLEDFRMFEAVAFTLYPAAKRMQPIEVEVDSIRNQIMALTRGRNPNLAQRRARSRFEDEHGNLKPYVSIVDKIEELLLEG